MISPAGFFTDLSPDSSDKVSIRGELSMAGGAGEGHRAWTEGLDIPLSDVVPRLLTGMKEKTGGRKPRKRKAKTEANGTTK